MMGISMCNVDPCMTVPGGRGKVLGTNPIAFAVPAGEERTVLLDIATSAVAASKIFAARALGEYVPDNWLVDERGIPTTDPSRYPESGAQLPMAGHKGYGIALLIEVLTSVLTGAAMASQANSWVQDVPEPSGQGFAFIALDIGAMMSIHLFKERMDWLIQSIKQAPKAEGTERIYLPGEMEWERRDEALAKGLLLPADVLASLAGLAQDMDLDLEAVFR
jgi:ureidoglycolate dehydrogenase (NAD+)